LSKMAITRGHNRKINIEWSLTKSLFLCDLEMQDGHSHRILFKWIKSVFLTYSTHLIKPSLCMNNLVNDTSSGEPLVYE
jgi:hypothetical protein